VGRDGMGRSGHRQVPFARRPFPFKGGTARAMLPASKQNPKGEDA